MSVTFIATLVPLIVLSPMSPEAWRPPELVVKDRVVADDEELQRIALQYVGRPYVMGGVGNPGFDCSGFTCRVFAEAGYAIPRVSRDQVNAGIEVSLDALAPGDLLFFTEDPNTKGTGGGRISHVGIYLGEGELVHASTGDGEIVVARLGSRWFADRLYAARRILSTTPMVVGTSSTSTTGVPVQIKQTPAPVLELVEHKGNNVLPPMLRRPVKQMRPSYGAELFGRSTTSLGVRSALLTENGVLGVVLAPEASLYLRSIALEVALAVPIRFELKEKATVGDFNSPKDVARFLRAASLGLRGADLEIRASQLGDLTLLSGLVVDKLSPGSLASGVPGLSVGKTPLAFFAGYRTPAVELQTIADDLVDPRLIGLGARVPIYGELLRASAGYSTHQGARALNAVEAELSSEVYENTRWTVLFSVAGAAQRALRENGALTVLRAEAEYRPRSSSAISLAFRSGFLGAHTLDGLFSGTYLQSPAEHLELLAVSQSRPMIGGEAHVRVGRFTFGALYEDALGEQRLGFDRRLDALALLQGLPIFGTTLLDLRVAYASRGVFRTGPTEHALHANAGLRLTSWLHLEAYAEKGERLEGGAGISLRFEP